MKSAVFSFVVVLLTIWTLGCAVTTVWYYPDVMQGAQTAAEAWQGLQGQRGGAAGDLADPDAVAGNIVWVWLFISALTWNVVATPLGIIALIAKPR